MISYFGFNFHFLNTNNVEGFFMCLLAVHMSSLVKCPFSSSVHFQLDSLSSYFSVLRVLYKF